MWWCIKKHLIINKEKHKWGGQIGAPWKAPCQQKACSVKTILLWIPKGGRGGVEDPAAAFITILDSSPSRYRLKAEKASHLENLPLTETADNHCHWTELNFPDWDYDAQCPISLHKVDSIVSDTAQHYCLWSTLYRRCDHELSLGGGAFLIINFSFLIWLQSENHD